MEYIKELCTCLMGINEEDVKKAARIIGQARIVFTAGNGGSSALASHLVNDLAKISKIKSICLSDNTSLLTAWANDESYDQVFARQFQNLAEPGDVLIVISSSGRSKNILRVVESAQKKGLKVIGMVGFDGGSFTPDVKLYIPSYDYGVVESAHSALVHWLTKLTADKHDMHY